MDVGISEYKLFLLAIAERFICLCKEMFASTMPIVDIKNANCLLIQIVAINSCDC